MGSDQCAIQYKIQVLPASNGKRALEELVSFVLTKVLPQSKHVCSAYFPLYAFASYVVYATTRGVSTDVQGGVYAVGAGGYGGFCPTWMEA